MNKIRIAVIGVGYLGKYHIEKFCALPNAKLVAACDIDVVCLEKLSQNYAVELTNDYKTLLGKVDAVSIVTPTSSHFEIARFFLENGVHVFVEKPITATMLEADILVSLAKPKNLILQCGHIERYNPAFQHVLPHIVEPSFIEALRISPFKSRGSDVSVVLDLMIHDIDIVLACVKSKIVELSATGKSVHASHLDIANVRIIFENGCVASLTASRISAKEMRRLTVCQESNIFDIDFKNNTASIHKKNEFIFNDSEENIFLEKIFFEKADGLRLEIEDFLKAIAFKKAPLVSGAEAKNALSLAIKINEIICENNLVLLDEKLLAL